MKKLAALAATSLVSLAVAGVVQVSSPAPAGATPSCTGSSTVTCTFSFTAAPQTLAVPAGATVTIAADGAGGADNTGTPCSSSTGTGGTGARVATTLPQIAVATTFTINVGGTGGAGCNGTGTGGAGGFNGGANGGGFPLTGFKFEGPGGGGASSVSTGGSLLVIAGGGGAAGGTGSTSAGGNGGNGGTADATGGTAGNATGSGASPGQGGAGGSTSVITGGAGGASGSAPPCDATNGVTNGGTGSGFAGTTVGMGGTGGTFGGGCAASVIGAGGGGGGGYFAGGGGGSGAVNNFGTRASGGAGGGGSSFATPSGTGTSFALSTIGTANANGQVTITYALQQADLSITKTDNVGGTYSAATNNTTGGTVVPGNSLVYTIVATNNGPAAVTGATVSDMFPSAIISDTWTATYTGVAAGPPSGSGNINATVNLGGGTATFTVVASTSPSATGSLVNTATVTAPAGTFDPDATNDSSTDTVTFPADLSITKTDNKATAVPGTTDTYAIVATNNGPGDVSGATVVDNFPHSEVTGDNWTATYSAGASGPASGSGDINTLVNLPANGSATFAVNATISPSAIGSLSNTATVVAPAGVTDPNPSNNSDTDTDTLTPQAALSVTKTGPSTATPGSNVPYAVTVKNTGPSDAVSAAMSDALPAGATFVSVTPPAGWTCPSPPSVAVGANGTVTCSTLLFAVNTTGVTFNIVAHVAPTFVGQLSNTATASSPTDPHSPESSGPVLTAVGCDHVLSSARGSLTVPASGVSCGSGISVGGRITVPAGASLVLTNASVHSVSARGAGAVTICGSQLGALRIQNSTGPVLVGDAGDDGSPACGPNTIRGSVILSGNTADVELGGNSIGGSATLTNNTGTLGTETSPEVEANTINGHLKCSGNSSISNGGLPNTVTGNRLGQCAGF